MLTPPYAQIRHLLFVPAVNLGLVTTGSYLILQLDRCHDNQLILSSSESSGLFNRSILTFNGLGSKIWDQ
jgi:hypothetical protein